MPIDPKDIRRAQVITVLRKRIEIAEKAKDILVRNAERANAQLAGADGRIDTWKKTIEREMGKLKESIEPPTPPATPPGIGRN